MAQQTYKAMILNKSTSKLIRSNMGQLIRPADELLSIALITEG